MVVVASEVAVSLEAAVSVSAAAGSVAAEVEGEDSVEAEEPPTAEEEPLPHFARYSSTLLMLSPFLQLMMGARACVCVVCLRFACVSMGRFWLSQ